MWFLLLELLQSSGIRKTLTSLLQADDTEEFLLGIGEAEWSTLLDQSLLEPATSTENKLLEAFSSGGGKENVSTDLGTDGENSCQTSTKRLK